MTALKKKKKKKKNMEPTLQVVLGENLLEISLSPCDKYKYVLVFFFFFWRKNMLFS